MTATNYTSRFSQSFGFPALYVLQVGFIPAYPSNGHNLTLILRHNNISVITYDMLQKWAAVPDLFVDFRNNPLTCHCDLRDMLLALANDSM
jgi:hypothetical protein